MEEEVIAVIIVLGIFAAVFLTVGIVPLVQYYRLTHGVAVTATVVEHICEKVSYNERQYFRYIWQLKLKYCAYGSEYVSTYGVCKKRPYMDAHPVGTEMKILVNIRNPKKFILPEDRWTLIIMGGMFTLGGIGSLAGVLSLLIK